MRPTPPEFQRGSPEWFARLAATGEWWTPQYWREKSYCEKSPWTLDELVAGFEAAKLIFDARTTRRLARDRAELSANPLRDFFTAPFSVLLRLGLEAQVAQIQKYPGLLKRLRQDGEHAGAVFELEMIAAMRRTGLDFDYEPFRGRPKQPNPDFLLRMGSESLVLDAKAAQTAARLAENQRWMDFLVAELQRGNVPPYEVEYLPDFVAAHRSDAGRSWVRTNLPTIGRATVVELRQLGYGQRFPGVSNVVLQNKALLRVVALGPSSEAASGSVSGADFDVETEAKRLTRGLLKDGASQIPRGMKGMVILNSGFATTTDALAQELAAWMGGEGREYPGLVGALVICGEVRGESYWQRLTPVWRPGQAAIGPSAWGALETGLNHINHRIAQWRSASPADS